MGGHSTFDKFFLMQIVWLLCITALPHYCVTALLCYCKFCRSYTPVTGDETPGQVTFVIKVYKAGVHPKFPEGGKMSQHLDSLDIGDTIDMKGPKGHMSYLGCGNFTVKLMRKPLESRHAKHFGTYIDYRLSIILSLGSPSSTYHIR